MAYSVQCPHCRAVMKSNNPIPGGKRIKCLKCQNPFTTTATEVNQNTHVQQKTARQPQAALKKKAAEPEFVEPEVVEPEIVEPEVVEPEIVEPEIIDDKVKPASRHRPLPHSRIAEEVLEPIVADDNEDFDEVDEESRPRKKKKKRKKSGSSKGLIIGLIAGGVGLVVVAAVVVILIFVLGSSSSRIHGKWEFVEAAGLPIQGLGKEFRQVYDFKSDGTLTVSTSVQGINADFHIKYTLSGSTLTVSDPESKIGTLGPRGTGSINVTFSGDEMIWSNPDNPRVTAKFRRVK